MKRSYFTLRNNRTGIEYYKIIQSRTPGIAERLIRVWIPNYTKISVEVL